MRENKCEISTRNVGWIAKNARPIIIGDNGSLIPNQNKPQSLNSFYAYLEK